MFAFGAHAIKNGLGPVLISLMRDGWLTHLATNGAGIIHDWELAFQGATSEDVRANVAVGEFGAWEETGRFLNLGLLVGAYRGLGYGASIGALIADEGLDIPGRSELEEAARGFDRDADRASAAIDLLAALEAFSIPSGSMRVPHPGRKWSVQAAAHALGVPFTGHPMIGHDIIYEHPLASGSAIGRTGMRDFLCFAEGVSRLSGGVYLSVGSAVMSPMMFEKSLNMARNLARQRGGDDRGPLHARRRSRSLHLGLGIGRRAARRPSRLLPALLQELQPHGRDPALPVGGQPGPPSRPPPAPALNGSRRISPEPPLPTRPDFR